MAKRGRIKREGTWHVLTLRVFQTAYDNTTGEEDSPVTWDWPTLLDKRYDDVELLGSKVDEDQEHHITDWAEDAHMTTGTGVDPKVQEAAYAVYETLTSNEAIREAIAEDRDDGPEFWDPPVPEDRVMTSEQVEAAQQRAREERQPRGRVYADPDTPIN